MGQRTLIIECDVTTYSDAQIKALYDAAIRRLCDAEDSHNDGHPGVENITFKLLERGELSSYPTRKKGARRGGK